MSYPRLERLLPLLDLEEKSEAESKSSLESDSDSSVRHLRVLSKEISPEGLTLVGLGFNDRRALPPDLFEAGDMILISGEKGDSRFRPKNAVVWEATPDELVVSVPQDVFGPSFEDESFRAERSADSITFRRMREAIGQVIESRDERVRAFRGLFNGERKPDPAFSRAAFEPADRRLNAEQKIAVQKLLAQPLLSALHGPPGTGKTAVLAELAFQLTRMSQTAYFAAPSNGAADALLKAVSRLGVPCVRIGHPARMDAEIRKHTLRGLYHSHEGAKELRQMEAERNRLRRRLREVLGSGFGPERGAKIREARESLDRLRADERRLEEIITASVLNAAKIFVGTPSGVLDPLIRDRRFDTVVMDEASQALEPIAWIPMLRADRVILAGDPYQLPPTIFSETAKREGLGRTLLEQALGILPEESRAFLPVQYRMNEIIGRFPSEEFYGGKLVPHESVREQLLSGLPGAHSCDETSRALEFIDTAGRGFEEEQSNQSFRNAGEAGIIHREVTRLLKEGVARDAIGIISPYSAQRRLLKECFGNQNIEIDTVDGYQGREKECVFVSCVRSNFKGEWGFLTDPRRFNVAWTRARRKLVVVGDSATLSALPVFGRWIAYAESAGVYRSAWEWVD